MNHLSCSLKRLVLVAALVAALAAPVAASAGSPSQQVDRFDRAVDRLLAEPYQAAYVPLGLDSAFAPTLVPNTAPAQDYTSGSIPESADNPDWPAAFQLVLLASGDGAPLFARVATHPFTTRPGVVVVHGFNTNGKESVIRWAAMLYANGYNVIASDQRSFAAEHDAGYGPPSWVQTFGWKESEDVLAAGRYLSAQPGVGDVGVMGFSLGAQDTVLALALDGRQRSKERVFSSGLAFSGPADQNTQVYSTAAPPFCQTPFCTYPATQALTILVVPPYSTGDPCKVLANAAAVYGTDAYSILTHESAYHAQTAVRVPLLTVYAADDPLVQSFHATMMAGYGAGNPLQRTLEVESGNHAYFYDRWWQQRAALLYFKETLPDASANAAVGVAATVNRTLGGRPFGEQLVPLGSPGRADADAIAFAAPYICDTTRPAPATTTVP
jgi:predicted alpha/beta-fold hydrolase